MPPASDACVEVTQGGMAVLATASVKLLGQKESMRVLCDGGAQANLISERVAKKLRLQSTGRTVRVRGWCAELAEECSREVRLTLVLNDGSQLAIACLVVAKLELDLPNEQLIVEVPQQCKGKLADPEFQSPGPVTMVVGAGLLALVTESQNIRHKGYLFQSTRLGWLVSGGSGLMKAESGGAHISLAQGLDLEQIVNRFWELEEFPKSRVRSKDEEECERIFKQSVQRDSTGRYIVRIPTRPQLEVMGSSKEAAWQRFLALKRRFERDPEYQRKYQDEMNSLLAAGYMLEVSRPAVAPVYHLPHHAVCGKWRVVYDASCKATGGLSLNECQYVGERLQDDLFQLLLRFRTWAVAITADIRKMYLQVKIPEDQYDLQRIFWQEEGRPVQEYWLTRVTFGMSSAPFCAVRAMQQCARDHSEQYPIGAKAVVRDFYVDDCLTGADSVQEAVEMTKQLGELLQRGGFELRRWCSNERAVTIAHEGEKDFAESMEGSVLGLRWLNASDMLAFKWRGRKEQIEPTKRGMLRDLAQIFDPLGLLGPATMRGKVAIRRLHVAKFAWDVQLPHDIVEEWKSWREALMSLQALQIPRLVNHRNIVAIHGFADASEVAYGAVVYAAMKQDNGQEAMVLLASRSRLAPLKGLTIPRLELCAAVVLARLVAVLVGAIDKLDVPIYLWTDSMITLHWIGREAGWKTFVHNRVQKIRDLSEHWQWGHVRSACNPADLLSRGVEPGTLVDQELWWSGPSAGDLQTETSQLSADEQQQAEAERKKEEVVMALASGVGDAPFEAALQRSSNLGRLIRAMCWIRRFARNCRSKAPRQTFATKDDMWNFLKTVTFDEAEERAALMDWCRIVQHRSFAAEIKAIKGEVPLPRGSPLLRLTPFLDTDGVLRILGRLESAPGNFERKHQVLLPGSSRLSKLIVWHVHKQTLHGGTQVMAAQLREWAWITRLRDVCRATTGSCVKCIRQAAKPVEQRMGHLPEERVVPGRPFEVSGVDYAGPFEVKPDLVRSRVRLKKWVAVFVCFKTKAVHLELVSDLSSRAFMRAFMRFTSIRGPCKELWSDNAKTFEGADSELQEMAKSWEESSWQGECNGMRVRWRFIAPRAPHQGGLWEAAVRSMKFHLYRVIGKQILNTEEWQTLLAQISAVLNSRPLMPISEDVEDLEYLTPQHLLTGGNAAMPVGHRLAEEPEALRNRYHLLQALLQGFWRRWQAEYVQSLQVRQKWTQQRRNIQVGDLVLLVEDDLAPSFWRTGRVQKVLPGPDGLVRNVRLKVVGAKKPWIRCVQKLVLLVGRS